MSAKNKTILYLDHAATTYLDPAVENAMQTYWSSKFGNPSSIYDLGMDAKFAVDEARNRVAAAIGATENEIIFTAGGTESVNMAIFGSVRQAIQVGKAKPHIITTSIEHHAVLESCRALEHEGVKVTYLPVDESGFVDIDKLLSAVRRETVLVSIIYANNEIGTVQNVSEIGKRLKKKNPNIIFHTDACQAPGALPLSVNKLNVDLMSLNGSKIYGPKQTGCLYVRRGIIIAPLIYGGGQERGLRSGTENVPGIVGFSAALEAAEKNRNKESSRLRKLRNILIKEIKTEIKNSLLNGPDPKSDSESHPARLPNNVNFSFPGVDGEALMLYLNAKGIEVSTGSACSSTSVDPSHVIRAIGRSPQDARSSIRITFGKINTEKDIETLMHYLPGLVEELRRVEWK
ncbi:cysteine desulfurase [Patescibacteria group bacterium]|nr:cysteine desulfurase [Patescibacteria group bacterium]